MTGAADHGPAGTEDQGYGGALARYYDSYFTGLEGEVEFYRRQAEASGGPVLEGGCGTGRTLFPVATAGVPITGVELSDEMLDLARARARRLPTAARERVTLRRGDLRHLPDVGAGYRLASLPYRTFQHLLTPAEQMAALRGLHERLAVGGELVLNLFDATADLVAVLNAPAPPDDPAAWPVDTQFEEPETGRTIRVRYRRGYDLAGQLLEQTFHFETLQDSRVVATESGRLQLRYTFRYEMEHLLARCGFSVVSLAGDFDGGPYRGYGEQVWVARRR